MLDAFMDESHDEQSVRAYCVAGFLATPTTWQRLWPRWSAMLERAGISAFHMADCEAQRGEFRNISRDECTALQREAIGHLTASDIGILGVASAIALEPYNELRPEIEKYRRILPNSPVSGSLGDPYFLAFQFAAELAASQQVQGIPSTERIAFVFDRTHLKGRASHLYEMLLTSPRLPYAHRLGALSFEDKKVMLPLQAADILAYECYRFTEDVKLDGKPERWQMTALKPTIATVRAMERENLEALIERMKGMTDEGEAISSGDPV